MYSRSPFGLCTYQYFPYGFSIMVPQEHPGVLVYVIPLRVYGQRGGLWCGAEHSAAHEECASTPVVAH